MQSIKRGEQIDSFMMNDHEGTHQGYALKENVDQSFPFRCVTWDK